MFIPFPPPFPLPLFPFLLFSFPFLSFFSFSSPFPFPFPFLFLSLLLSLSSFLFLSLFFLSFPPFPPSRFLLSFPIFGVRGGGAVCPPAPPLATPLVKNHVFVPNNQACSVWGFWLTNLHVEKSMNHALLIKQREMWKCRSFVNPRSWLSIE